MSFLLWLDEESDAAIDLGDPFDLFKAFGEMAAAAGGDNAEFAELFSVPGEGEQEVDLAWLAEVRRQAAAFLERHGHALSAHARWALGKLASKAGAKAGGKPGGEEGEE